MCLDGVSDERLAQWAALTVPVGPTRDLSEQQSVGTSAEDVDLRKYQGARIAVVADGRVAAVFGRAGTTLPDPSTSSGDLHTAEPGGDYKAQTYFEHYVSAGETDKMRIVAASASTNVRIFAISRSVGWWRGRIARGLP